MSDTFLSNKGKRILFVFFAFLLMYFVSYIVDPYSFFWENYFDRSKYLLFTEWTASFFFCLIISEVSILIHTKLNKSLPWTEQPEKRMVVETALNLVSVLVILFVNLFCYWLLNGESLYIHSDFTKEETRGLTQWVVVSIIIAFMIISINTSNFLILNWKNSAIDAAEHKLKATEHKQAATEAELQALKLQIDPHFVFNNLSVLSELILEDQQLGYEYAENFSKVYRYLLINSKRNMILLSDELKFLSAYIFLVQHRVGQGVSFEIDVSSDSNNLYLPPLTLQLLVENALKHNKTIKNSPLMIKVYSDKQDFLVIENKMIPLEKPVISSGIGIQNIVSRYELLSDRAPEIVKNTESFKVFIPLIKL